MSILLPKVASVFGALDSDLVADGGAADSHVGEVLATSANRLACIGEPLARFIFDASTDMAGEEGGQLLAFGEPFWFQITPGPITRPKMPRTTRGRLYVHFQARAGEVLYLQVHTAAAPFSPQASAGANVLVLAGTGSDAWATLEDIPLVPGVFEQIAVYLRGTPTTTAGNTAVYGAPNTGTIDAVPMPNIIQDLGSGWITSPHWGEGGHAVTFEDGLGNQILSPRSIVNVLGNDWLQIYPPLDAGWSGRALIGATYHIVELPRIRINSMMLYAQDREV